ncbi:short chain dehydrogenase, partial [Acinetobacter baumannii]
ITRSDDLIAIYNFFNPVIRKLAASGRIIVVGRTPELLEDAKHATAQRALEGFTRALGKEVKKGSTAQLIYVAPGADADLESTLRF